MKIKHKLGDETPHKDAFGHTLKIGDVIVYNARNLGTFMKKAVIVNHSKERVRLIDSDKFKELQSRDTMRAYGWGDGHYDVSVSNQPENVVILREPLPDDAGKWFA